MSANTNALNDRLPAGYRAYGSRRMAESFKYVVRTPSGDQLGPYSDPQVAAKRAWEDDDTMRQADLFEEQTSLFA